MSKPTTLAALCDFIASETKFSFALWAWDHAPAGSYGVVSQDEDSTFFADGNAERVVRGYVDYFARSDGFAEKAAIETALQKSGWHWRHLSVQYEDSGIVHHEFRVAWLG